MFTLQVQGIASQLAGVLPQSAIDALIQVFGNCAQELQHRGPVSILTYGDQPSLTLSNDKPGQSALTVTEGNVTNNGDLIQNGNSYFNNPATFNNETYLNDDLVFAGGGDLIIKYCQKGLGSTLARIKLTGTFDENGNANANIVDCDGNPVGSNNSSGIASGTITVHTNCKSTLACGKADDCGFAVYMSDCDPSGAENDCTHRPNTGQWEVISLSRHSADGVCTVEVLDKVCCIGDEIITCTKTLKFTEPVEEIKDACACP